MSEDLSKLKNSQGGFSLLEIVLAIALSGVLFLFVTRMLDVSSKSIAYQEFSITKNELQMELINYKMNSLRSCSCMLEGRTFAPSALPADVAIPASGIASVRYSDPNNCASGTVLRTIAQNNQKINKATIKDVSFDVVSGSGNNWTGNIKVEIESDRKVQGPSSRTIVTSVDLITQDSGALKEIQQCVLGTGGANTPGTTDVVGVGVGDSMPPTHGLTQAVNFPNVPSNASAVILAYKIGLQESGGREDRYCVFQPSGLYIGYDSRGDGDARMAAGSIIVPLNPGQTVRCDNSGSSGYIRVIGVIY